jgi:hypothetical protein
MSFLFAVQANMRRLIPAHHGEGCRVGPRLCSASPVDGIFLLEVADNHVRSERGRIHGGIQGQLEMLMVIAKSVEEKNDFNLVKVNRSHVGNPHVHGQNLVGTITEGSIAAVAEIESLFEEKELSVRTEFLVALLEFFEDEMRRREMGNYVVVHFRDAPTDESMKGAIVCLPDVMCLGVKSGVGLR